MIGSQDTRGMMQEESSASANGAGTEVQRTHTTAPAETKYDDEQLRTLALRQKSLSDVRDRFNSVLFWANLASVALLGYGGILVWINLSELDKHPFSMLCVVYGLVLPVMSLQYRSRVRELDDDLKETNFLIELHNVSNRESRAEKLLRINDLQLRRYYDLNLGQNQWVFLLGIGTMLVGVSVLVYALHFLSAFDGAKGDTVKEVATAVLGGIGAILSNFVAAIYLRMNTTTAESLASFHSRLVETQQLMLGNLLASRIEDDRVRWETLAALSLRLIPEKNEQYAKHNTSR